MTYGYRAHLNRGHSAAPSLAGSRHHRRGPRERRQALAKARSSRQVERRRLTPAELECRGGIEPPKPVLQTGRKTTSIRHVSGTPRRIRTHIAGVGNRDPAFGRAERIGWHPRIRTERIRFNRPARPPRSADAKRLLEREAGLEPVIFAVETRDPEPLDDARKLVPPRGIEPRYLRLQRSAWTTTARAAFCAWVRRADSNRRSRAYETREDNRAPLPRKNWSQRMDSNHRLERYERPDLPLIYAGVGTDSGNRTHVSAMAPPRTRPCAMPAYGGA